MPKRDDEYMAQRREKILDAAVQCMTRTGLAGLSTTAICEAAEISMGALYTHFATKDEIVVGLAERAARRRREAFNFESAADMRRRLLLMAEQMGAKDARQGTRVDIELFAASYGDPRIAAALEPLWDFSDFAKVLERLKTAGELRREVNAKALATAIESHLMGAMIFGFVGAGTAKTRRDALALLLDSAIA
jgi:AcrR family transcriptional regulator